MTFNSLVGRSECQYLRFLVGDIVHLQPGDIMPADGVILEGSLSVDESSSTGESRSVERSRGSMVRGETKILDGSALTIIMTVGQSTFHGRMMSAMTNPSSHHP